MKTRYAPDRGLTSRMSVTMFGLGLLYLLVIVGLIWWGVSTSVVLVLAAASLFFQWYFSDRIALFAMRAQDVSQEQAPELHAVIDRLCAMADMPKPRVTIADTDLPNAFATGRNQRASAVCVTTGLLRRLTRDEVEAVLAHELSHIAHRDVTVMAVASFIGVLAGLLTRSFLYGGIRRGNRDSAVGLLVIMLVSVLVYFASVLLVRALSRYRELAADRAGALLTGRPDQLAAALQKVTGEMGAIPMADLRRAEPVNAFFFAPAAVGGVSLATLFSTHPPLEARLANLAKVAAELGQR